MAVKRACIGVGIGAIILGAAILWQGHSSNTVLGVVFALLGVGLLGTGVIVKEA